MAQALAYGRLGPRGLWSGGHWMGEGRGCGRLGSRIRGGWVQDDVGMGVREKEERDGEREKMWERVRVEGSWRK